MEPAEMNFNYDCTKCHQKILPPVYQCYDGHLLCELCSQAVKTCPVCKESLPTTKRIRSIEVEKIITRIQDHPCPYELRGCTEKIKYDDLEDHKLDCRYAFLPFCSILTIDGCKQEVSKSSFVRHLQKDHCKSVYVSDIRSNRPCKIRFFPPSRNYQKTYCQFLLMRMQLEDSQVLFVIRIKYKKGHMIWTPCVVGGDKSAARYTFSVSLGTHKNPILTWKGRVFSLVSKREELETSFTTTLAYIKNEIKNDKDTFCAKITFFETSPDNLLTNMGRKMWTSLTTQPEWTKGIQLSLPWQPETKESRLPEDSDQNLPKYKSLEQKLSSSKKKEFYFWITQALLPAERTKANKVVQK